jgi:hypothetical protein
MSENSEDSEKPVAIKIKSKMSDERLAQLSAARAKAVEKRKMLGDLTRAEKAARDDVITKRIAKLNVKEEVEKKKKKKIVTVSSSESESESESEEPEEVKLKPKSKSKSRPKQDPFTQTELSASIARRQLQEKIHRDTYQSAFQSLFPGHTLNF